MRNSTPKPLHVIQSPEPQALSPELAEGSKDTINFFNMKRFLRKYRVLAIAFVIANLFLVSGAIGQTTYYLKTASQTNAQIVTNWNTDATGGGGGTTFFYAHNIQ